MADSATSAPTLADAVTQANEILEQGVHRAVTAIAFMEISQNLTLAVQSGVTQLQSIFTLNVATTGVAFAQAFESADQDPKQVQARLQGTLEDSQGTVQAAIKNLATLTAEAAKALQNFPSDLGSKV